LDNVAYARDVLAAMFAPAVLISAAGTLVLSTSNRLSRVVDRVRTLTDEVAKSNAMAETSVEAKSRQRLVSDQLNMLFLRAMLLRAAVTILYIGLGMFVGTTVAVGIVASLDWRFGWIPVATEILGGTFLLYASTLLVREARMAVKTTLQEMDYARDLLKRSG
jgi:hypothetical protein